MSTASSVKNKARFQSSERSARIAYLVSRFPSVTETFVLNEMLALRRLGLEPSVYAFIQDMQLLRHPGADDFIANCTEARLLSREGLSAQIHWLRRRPLAYGRLWLDAIRFNLRSPKFLSRAFVVVPKAAAFARHMQNSEIDHVHAHFGTHSALAAFAVKRLTGIDYSVTLHAHDLYVDRSMLRQKLESAAFIATISEFNRNMLRDLYGDQMVENVSIVRCGVDVDKFRPVEDERTSKNEKRIFRILCVGSLQPYKGQRHLIDACAELNAMGIDYECQLIGDGESRQEIEQAIERHELGNHVTLLGALPSEQVHARLAEADVFVLPSIITERGKMEGIPVALMEAMALEIPVLTSRISGIPELVEDGVTGRLVEQKDASALCAALIELHRDADQRHRLGRAGRQRVLQRFDLESNAQRLYDLLIQHIASRSSLRQTNSELEQK